MKNYEVHKQRMREKQLRQSLAGREIATDFPIRAKGRAPKPRSPDGFRRAFCQRAAPVVAEILYSALTGDFRTVLIEGSSKEQAIRVLESVKDELRTSRELLSAFPEIVYPIQRQGKAQSRPVWQGREIQMLMQRDLVMLPDLPGHQAAGVQIIARKFGNEDEPIIEPSKVIRVEE